METIFKGILPFFLAMLMIILIHYVFPDRVIFAKVPWCGNSAIFNYLNLNSSESFDFPIAYANVWKPLWWRKIQMTAQLQEIILQEGIDFTCSYIGSFSTASVFI